MRREQRRLRGRSRLLCPSRYRDRLVRGTAERLNRIAALAEKFSFEPVRFMVELREALLFLCRDRPDGA